MDDEKLTKLLQHCSKYPAMFNKVSNILYKDFGNLGSVPALLITFFITKYRCYYEIDGVHVFEICPDESIIGREEG